MNKEAILKVIIASLSSFNWLDLDYENLKGEQTTYWAYIKDIFKSQGHIYFKCIGFYKSGLKKPTDLTIRLDGIKRAALIEGTYHEVDNSLMGKASGYEELNYYITNESFNKVNRILEYFYEANLFDTPAYIKDHLFIEGLDEDTLKDEKKGFPLTDAQFNDIYKKLFKEKKKDSELSLYKKELGLNVLSINYNGNLYILAYRSLLLDILNKCLVPSNNISINYQFVFENGEVKSRKSLEFFLSEDDMALLNDVAGNMEKIKEALLLNNSLGKVDDAPHIYNLERYLSVDLKKQYEELSGYLFDKRKDSSIPLQTFFFDYMNLKNHQASKPLILYDPKKTNLDQLLAINKALKDDILYVQGPPGTGKTNTIISVILSAYYNKQTVLVSSQNNHPVDGIYKVFDPQNEGTKYYLPILRLGNREVNLKAMQDIKGLLTSVINEDSKTIKSKELKIQNQQKEALAKFLSNYEERLDLLEQLEATKELFDEESFGVISDFFIAQRQSLEKRLNKLGTFKEEEALNYLLQDDELIKSILSSFTKKRLLALMQPEYENLRSILNLPEESLEDKTNKVTAFNSYLKVDRNFEQLLKVFPIIITTNLSCGRLGGAYPHFDLTIIDEAGQSPVATSLLPVCRGKRLMLLGDTQQLKPVIVLDPVKNLALKEHYKIEYAYDYLDNSIYSSFVKLDPLSDEILLRYHYRNDPCIISFNNKKFYNGKLLIKSNKAEEKPLAYVNTKDAKAEGKNTSINELTQIVRYVKSHPDENLAIITPFVRQKELLKKGLEMEGITNVEVGTVHSFQGDEKDAILFSSAITSSTREGTYKWLRSNKELINVATSRARKKLIIYGDYQHIKNLHELLKEEKKDDHFYELVEYVSSNGQSEVSLDPDISSRALLGHKTYSSKVEEEFKESLAQALTTLEGRRFKVAHNVAISDVLVKMDDDEALYFTGHFDFVIYKKALLSNEQTPVLAFEVDGPEHLASPQKERDEIKNKIAQRHNLALVRVANSYSRRYYLIKNMLLSYLRVK